MTSNEMKDVLVRDEPVLSSLTASLKGRNQPHLFDMLEFSHYILFGAVETEITLETYFQEHNIQY